MIVQPLVLLIVHHVHDVNEMMPSLEDARFTSYEDEIRGDCNLCETLWIAKVIKSSQIEFKQSD